MFSAPGDVRRAARHRCGRASAFDAFGRGILPRRNRPGRRAAADYGLLRDAGRPLAPRPLFPPGRSGARRSRTGLRRQASCRAARQSWPGRRRVEPRCCRQCDRGAGGDRETLPAAARRRDPLSNAVASHGAAGMKYLSRMLLGAMLLGGAIAAPAAEPIKIGFSMELTGPFAVVGKTGLLAFKIWEEEVNAEGGLLGRPVKLVYYDDQSNSSLVPGIYTKLIDIDKVDLLISSYGTNLVVPAIPVAISRNRLFFGLFALAANDKFHYPKYFSMLPFGPEPVKTLAQGWFELAAAQNPKPKTVAIVATDAEFQHKAAESARQHAKARGIDIVYDRAYPPTTVDFTPIVPAVQAAQPDLVYVSSYPSDTVGILRSVGELGLDTKMLGGGLAGLQAAAIKMQLAEAANGIVNVDLWEPVPTMQFPGVMAFIKKYQAKAPAEGVDLLGYFLPPFAFSELQSSATQSPRRRAST